MFAFFFVRLFLFFYLFFLSIRENCNDDHMFEILRTEMTQLAIASELTRSHYLLIQSYNVRLLASSFARAAPICSRNLFAQDITARAVWFFFFLFSFLLYVVVGFFYHFFCPPLSLPLSPSLSLSLVLVVCAIFCYLYFVVWPFKAILTSIHFDFIQNLLDSLEPCSQHLQVHSDRARCMWLRRKANERKGLLFIIR